MARKVMHAAEVRAVNMALTALTVVLLVIIIWIDVASNIWQETTILSGLAAGFVTFLFTALFLERAIARRERLRWLPVTSLALADLLHTIADDDTSDIHRRRIVARSLPVPEDTSSETLSGLLKAVVAERNDISISLARWSEFLVSSANVQTLMNHVATLGISLNDVRDTVVELESGETTLGLLQAKVEEYNTATRSAIKEIMSVLKEIEMEQS